MTETKRFLSKAEVKAKIKLSYTHTKRLVDAGKFPKPLRLGPYQTSRTVYVEAEVDAWMDQQIKRHLRPE